MQLKTITLCFQQFLKIVFSDYQDRDFPRDKPSNPNNSISLFNVIAKRNGRLIELIDYFKYKIRVYFGIKYELRNDEYQTWRGGGGFEFWTFYKTLIPGQIFTIFFLRKSNSDN